MLYIFGPGYISGQKNMRIFHKWQNLSMCTATPKEIILTSRNAFLPLLKKLSHISQKKGFFTVPGLHLGILKPNKTKEPDLSEEHHRLF